MTPVLFVSFALLASAPPAPNAPSFSAGPSPDASRPSCRTVDSSTACGYGCVHDSFGVQCARTPQGRCALVDGKASCFDPPAFLVRLYGEGLPAPACKTLDGRVACGYACAADFGDVQCARTPRGVCQARAGKVVCFDPPTVVYAVWGIETPVPECRAQGSQIACGYGCLTGVEGVRCARTPAGLCKSANGRLGCFDPAPAALCAQGRSLPPLECRESDGNPVCGYACATAFSRANCARTPRGICKVVDAQVTCFDPPSSPTEDSVCLAALGLTALDEESAQP